MNVLQLISSGLGYYGAERVVVTLSAALEQAGVHTVVGAFLNTAKTTHMEVLDRARSSGLRTEQIPCQGRLDRSAISALREIIDRHDIDVIHCHGIKPDLYALLAARYQNVRLVSTCHLWTFDSAKDWLVSALERCLLHGVDQILVVSDHILPQLLRFGLRAEVIYNGIDLAPFGNPSIDFRREAGWSGRPVIGTVGRLASQKGLRFLLDAAPQILKQSPDAIFVFVGEGPDRALLESQAKRLGIQDAVEFLGVRQDIPAVLSAIDVLAMPSLDEGLPMTLLEAMASRKPVVAAKVGAIPHVIQNRVNGILFDSGDTVGLSEAIQELLRCEELRKTLGERARDTVQSQFSSVAMAAACLEIYSRLTSARTPKLVVTA